MGSRSFRDTVVDANTNFSRTVSRGSGAILKKTKLITEAQLPFVALLLLSFNFAIKADFLSIFSISSLEKMVGRDAYINPSLDHIFSSEVR